METKSKYIVTTEDNALHVIEFTELNHPTPYGNGKMILIDNLKTGEANIADVRFIKRHVFQTFCENWIKNYFGENLLNYKEIE